MKLLRLYDFVHCTAAMRVYLESERNPILIVVIFFLWVPSHVHVDDSVQLVIGDHVGDHGPVGDHNNVDPGPSDNGDSCWRKLGRLHLELIVIGNGGSSGKSTPKLGWILVLQCI